MWSVKNIMTESPSMSKIKEKLMKENPEYRASHLPYFGNQFYNEDVAISDIKEFRRVYVLTVEGREYQLSKAIKYAYVIKMLKDEIKKHGKPVTTHFSREGRGGIFVFSEPQ